MALNKTLYHAQAQLNKALNNTDWTHSATVYLALYTDSAFTTEVSGGSYARTAISFGAVSGSDNFATNDAACTFPSPTADWNSGNPIGYAQIMDASTSGNALYRGTLTTAVTILNGGTALSFPIGSVRIEEEIGS